MHTIYIDNQRRKFHFTYCWRPKYNIIRFIHHRALGIYHTLPSALIFLQYKYLTETAISLLFQCYSRIFRIQCAELYTYIWGCFFSMINTWGSYVRSSCPEHTVTTLLLLPVFLSLSPYFSFLQLLCLYISRTQWWTQAWCVSTEIDHYFSSPGEHPSFCGCLVFSRQGFSAEQFDTIYIIYNQFAYLNRFLSLRHYIEFIFGFVSESILWFSLAAICIIKRILNNQFVFN